ncbi:MAG: transglutaminase family protein [Candidatus Omnitrophica bacterium]|nr:transglutaminase family protein [Candidatus Omnitrophota bacterium]
MNNKALKITKVIKIAILSLGFLLNGLIFINPAFSQTIQSVANQLKSAQDLSLWFNKEFRYETEMPDRWQSAEETLRLKKGDCEDFAILSKELLGRKGIKGDIVVIKFQGVNQSHAIFIFKEGKYFSFISNKQLIQTNSPTLAGAIQEQFPDWEKITFATAKKEAVKVVLRNNHSGNTQLESDVASDIR